MRFAVLSDEKWGRRYHGRVLTRLVCLLTAKRAASVGTAGRFRIRHNGLSVRQTSLEHIQVRLGWRFADLPFLLLPT